MQVDFKRPSTNIKYLSSLSSENWLELALSNPIEILIDHAHGERKAAGVAIQLMFRYPSEPDLAEVLSPIAREELEHFEKILVLLRILVIRLKLLSLPHMELNWRNVSEKRNHIEFKKLSNILYGSSFLTHLANSAPYGGGLRALSE